MRLGQIIKNFREVNKMSIRDFAKKSGLSKSYVSYLENKKDNSKETVLGSDKVAGLASALNMTIDEFFANADDMSISTFTQKPNSSLQPVPDLRGLKKIPLLGSISCGKPIYATPEYGYVEVEELSKADFCLRAQPNIAHSKKYSCL